MINKQVSIEDARLYIDQLDLHYIVASMCSHDYPLPRWEMQDALRCLTLYKNFLLLQKKHLPETLVPTREIDEFWHNHILYTKNYFQDCLNIFGHYLHHEPVSPDEDSQQLVSDYLKTKQFYLDEFGEPLDLILSSG
ncbi:MAG: hypothetical protein SFW66_00360 [Gammaproteobacteria bacterium]|nr:hypothetical protein [Gammaproteobacteria bacterium]